MNCEYCKSNELEIIGEVFFLNTLSNAVMCKNCGNVIKNYHPSSEELNNFYQNIGHDNEILYSHKLEEQLNFLNNHLKMKDISTVLEVGPGPKGLIALLDNKISKYSCEIDEKSINTLKESGIINFNSLDKISKKFDLIILSHVVEHIIEDIEVYIKSLESLLSENGKIFIEAPSADYELMIHNNKLINHYFSDGHKRSSTSKSYKLLLKRIGLKEYFVETCGSNIRKKEYKCRFEYSKILDYFCKNKNARSYFLKILPKFMYNFLISIFYSTLIKKYNIPQGNIKIIIYKNKINELTDENIINNI